MDSATWDAISGLLEIHINILRKDIQLLGIGLCAIYLTIGIVIGLIIGTGIWQRYYMGLTPIHRPIIRMQSGIDDDGEIRRPLIGMSLGNEDDVGIMTTPV